MVTLLYGRRCFGGSALLHRTFDEDGYPTDPYAEVVPGLFQADTTYTPPELFRLGFDAVFDLCGIDRGDGVLEEEYVVHPIDDVPWISDPDAIHQLGLRVADLIRSKKWVAVNCMSGLNRSGLLVGRALIALGHSPREAIELVRRARGPRALANHQFVRFLLIDCGQDSGPRRSNGMMVQRLKAAGFSP
jgi:hypothetical protein